MGGDNERGAIFRENKDRDQVVECCHEAIVFMECQ